METPGGVALHAASAVLVRSNAPHQLSIPGPKVAVLYIDPHSPVAPGLERWLGARDMGAISPDLVTDPRARLLTPP